MTAAKYDLQIDQGADFSIEFTITDDNGDLVNLTGYTFLSEIKKNVTDLTALKQFTFTILNQITDTGKVEMTLSRADILEITLGLQETPQRMSEQFVYDIFITDTDPFTSKLLSGSVMISPGVSLS